MSFTPSVLIRAKVPFNRTSKMELRFISNQRPILYVGICLTIVTSIHTWWHCYFARCWLWFWNHNAESYAAWISALLFFHLSKFQALGYKEGRYYFPGQQMTFDWMLSCPRLPQVSSCAEAQPWWNKKWLTNKLLPKGLKTFEVL